MATKSELKPSNYMLDKDAFFGLENRDSVSKTKGERLRFDESTKAGKLINETMDDIYGELNKFDEKLSRAL